MTTYWKKSTNQHSFIIYTKVTYIFKNISSFFLLKKWTKLCNHLQRLVNMYHKRVNNISRSLFFIELSTVFQFQETLIDHKLIAIHLFIGHSTKHFPVFFHWILEIDQLIYFMSEKIFFRYQYSSRFLSDEMNIFKQ